MGLPEQELFRKVSVTNHRALLFRLDGEFEGVGKTGALNLEAR